MLSVCVCAYVCVFIVGAAAEEKTPKRDEVEMKPKLKLKLKPQVIRSLRRVSSMCFSLDSSDEDGFVELATYHIHNSKAPNKAKKQ